MAISFPSSPTNGQVFTAGNITWVWNGTSWDAGTPGAITVSDTPPSTPTTGSLWYESDVGKLRIYYSNTWIDASPTGVSSGVGTTTSAYVNAGTFVTLDNLKATLTSSGNRGLSLATVTGSFTAMIGGTYAVGSGSGGISSNGSTTISTTPSVSFGGWNFAGQGDISTYILTDITNSKTYRITLQIGGGYANNFISIERLK